MVLRFSRGRARSICAMSGVDVAAEDNRSPLGTQPLAQREECVVERQLVGDAAVIAAAVGEVAVDQREIGVVGDDRAAFVVELRIAQAKTHSFRYAAREECGAAVALLALRSVPEGVVARRLAHLGRELFGVAARFLQAQDVRCGLGQPRQEAGAMGGAGAVDVPGEQGDRGHRPGFYATSAWPSTASDVRRGRRGSVSDGAMKPGTVYFGVSAGLRHRCHIADRDLHRLLILTIGTEFHDLAIFFRHDVVAGGEIVGFARTDDLLAVSKSNMHPSVEHIAPMWARTTVVGQPFEQRSGVRSGCDALEGHVHPSR